MMDNKKIQLILQDALEDEIPAAQIQLWPVVKANFVAGKTHTLQQGEKMKTVKSIRVRFALAISVIVVLLAIFFVTPPGRSFAQSILQFFLPAESTTFPLQPSQIADNAQDTTDPTAEPPSPLISVTEAEAQVGFDVAELPFVPDGLNFLGVRLYGNVVSLEYETQDKGGHLIIQQLQMGNPQSAQEGYLQSDWDKVPSDAVIPVKINESNGEFVQGTFVVYPNETSATWNPDAPILRLRWEMDGIWFEMSKSGNVEVIEYLDQAELIKLAEQLVINP